MDIAHLAILVEVQVELIPERVALATGDAICVLGNETHAFSVIAEGSVPASSGHESPVDQAPHQNHQIIDRRLEYVVHRLNNRQPNQDGFLNASVRDSSGIRSSNGLVHAQRIKYVLELIVDQARPTDTLDDLLQECGI